MDANDMLDVPKGSGSDEKKIEDYKDLAYAKMGT